MNIVTEYNLGDLVYGSNAYGYPCSGKIIKIIISESGVLYNFGYGNKTEDEIFRSLDEWREYEKNR